MAYYDKITEPFKQVNSQKLHQMTVCERRELFGLPNHIEPMAEKNIAKIPLGVVQLPSAIFNQSFYPLKQEEASVIAGATGMGKLVNPKY